MPTIAVPAPLMLVLARWTKLVEALWPRTGIDRPAGGLSSCQSGEEPAT